MKLFFPATVITFFPLENAMKNHSAIAHSYALFLEELGLIDTKIPVSVDEIMNDPDKVQLIREHLAKRRVGSSILDAHRWLSNMLGNYPSIEFTGNDFEGEKTNYRITEETYICHPSLLAFLEKLGIPITVAQVFFKQARIYDAEVRKPFYSLIHRNDEEGIIVSTKSGQDVIGANDITFISGSIPQHGGIHIFRDAFDYLSALMQVMKGRKFLNDAIILNFYSNLNKAAPYFKKYEYDHLYNIPNDRNHDVPDADPFGYKDVYSWLPNDKPGKLVTKVLNAFLRTETGLTHTPMNKTYASYRDISTYHKANLGLVI